MSEVPGGETAALIDSGSAVVDSSVPHSPGNSVVDDIDPAVVDLSEVPVAHNESKPAHITESTTMIMGASEYGVDSLQNEEKSTRRINIELAGVVPFVNSDGMTSGGRAADANMSASVDILALHASVDSTEGVGVDSTVEPESMNKEDLLLHSAGDTPETSLVPAREDQVTDVGCALLLTLNILNLLIHGLL